MRHVITIVMAMGLIFGLAGCATNPVTGESDFILMSSSKDVETGKMYAPEVEKQMGGRIEDTAIQSYVNSVGQSIAKISHQPNMKFHYTAVNSDEVNAVALPGGYIFITKGLLKLMQSEAQLAFVLAHETVHVTARHSAQAMSQQIGMDIALAAVSEGTDSQAVSTLASVASDLTQLKYSRSHELEADQYGLDYTVKAGYNPKASIEVMKILQEQSQGATIEFFATHPNPGNRNEKLWQKIQRTNYPLNLKAGYQEYKDSITAKLK